MYLVQAEVIAFEPQRQIEHVLVARAGMRGDEVGDEVLLFARFFGVLLEQLFETVVRAHFGLHHFGQRPCLGVLRRDFQIAADVVLHQFFDVFG